MSGGGRESSHIGHFLGQHRALVALGAKQHGVLSLSQLRTLGLSANAVYKRAADGRLHRLYRGAYSLVPRELLTAKGNWMAAVLACGQDAVLSHRSAAALHELRRTDRANIDVTVPGRSDREHRGIDLHRSLTLAAADTTTVDHIPCTTVARTLLDLGEVLTPRQLERVLDQAEILEVLDGRALEDQLERNRKRPGSVVLGAVLSEHYPGRTPTWSELEEEFLKLVRRAGLPGPEVNAWVDPGDGEPPIRVDFLWREQRVVVETDGHVTHRTRQAFERDRRRDQRLTAAQFRPIRATWSQIARSAEQLAETVASLLGP